MMNDPRIPSHAHKVFTGKIFDVWQWEQEQFDGSTKTFESVARPDTAQVIATTEDDRLLVLHQEQPGRPPFLCVAGGVVEKNMDPLEEAKRELLEETGYASDDWTLWQTFQPHYKTVFTAYYYIARRCRKVQDPQPDSGERITVESVSFDDFLRLSDRDDFRNPELLVALLRMRIHDTKRQSFRTLLFG